MSLTTKKIKQKKEQNKMNEYLYEMELSIGDNATDEEVMYVMATKRVAFNIKKRLQKENNIYGKESNYNLYC